MAKQELENHILLGLEHCLDNLEDALRHEFPNGSDRHEVVIQCDSPAHTYEGDIAERIKKVGLTFLHCEVSDEDTRI